MSAQDTQAKAPGFADLLAGLSPQRRAEAARLAQIFQSVTGFSPLVWPGGMVGFGRYAYRYASGHGGTSLATGFAARKADLVIYLMAGLDDQADLLARLGPHRLGKSCLYLKRLVGVDEAALADLIRAGLADLARRWPIEPT